MIKIAICDDCPDDLKQTEKMVQISAQRIIGNEISIECFASPNALLEKKQDFHLFFLDILMPAFDGIQLGAMIREDNTQAVIIYTTSAPDFALDAFSVRAFGYLLKPFKQETLDQTLEDAIARIQFEQHRFLPVKTKSGLTTVSFHAILYIEYTNHRIYVHTLDRKVLVSTWSKLPFDQLAQPVSSDPCFIKPHISFLINMRHITALRQDHTFKMRDGVIVPIAKSVYKDVKNKYLQFLVTLAEGE